MLHDRGAASQRETGLIEIGNRALEIGDVDRHRQLVEHGGQRVLAVASGFQSGSQHAFYANGSDIHDFEPPSGGNAPVIFKNGSSRFNVSASR